MLKWLKQLKNKETGKKINLGEFGEKNKNYKLLKVFKISNTIQSYKNNSLELSINEYVSKLRKKLLLIEKLKQNNVPKRALKKQITLSNSRLSIRSKEDLFKKLGKIKIKDMSNIIWNESEQCGEKMTMAINVLRLPFIKFKINQKETYDEIDYIFSKTIRTSNEMIYLQHLLTLFDVVPSLYTNYDLIEPNEVLFNMAICLNMHKYEKDELVFRYGEYCDKLFYVLSGSVSLFEPLERSCQMDINQYINYLNQLEKFEEYELIKKIIDNNKVYRNNVDVSNIKINNEKHLRKKYFQKMKAIKEIIKSQDYSIIEVSLNNEINLTIDTTTDVIIPEDFISNENYMKRVIPSFLIDIKNEENQESEKENLNSDRNIMHKRQESNKNTIKYYIYSLVKKLEPFNIFGEILIDDEENKNNVNNNNSNNYKKRELTAICNEPSRILYLDINNWLKYFKFRQESIKMRNILTILDIPFLKHINKEYFKEKIFEYFTLFNYKIGDYIFKQNEIRKKIYFIRSGEVELIMNASIYDINNIIDKKFDNNDIYNRNKLSESQKIKFIDSYYLINKLNDEKKIKTWRLLCIYPKDIIGLNEILNVNNETYYLSAKCCSYNCEIYEIEYEKFKNLISEDKNVKNLFAQYTKNKMNFISKRLKTLRTIYINSKLKNYKNYLKNSFSSVDKIKIKNKKFNNFLNKRKYLKLGILNNILEPSLTSNNLNIVSDNNSNLNSNNSETIYNYHTKTESKTLMIKTNINRNNKFKNLKLFNYKNAIYNNTNNNYINVEDFSDEIENKKNNNNKIFSSIFKDIGHNKLNFHSKSKSNIDKKINEKKFSKTQTFKNKSLGLIKFKDFNNLNKKNKKLQMNNKYSLSQKSFFKNYLKEVTTLGVASAKKPEITPFSDLLFSLADIDNKKSKIELKSTSSSMECSATSKNNKNSENNNNIDFLILDKIIERKGYPKFMKNNLSKEKISKSLNIKNLKKQLKILNKKKQFPPHLIRRFETNRKINYFPEKLLHFVK